MDQNFVPYMTLPGIFREIYYFSVIFINFILLSYISVHCTVSAVTRMFNQEVKKKHDLHPEVLI